MKNEMKTLNDKTTEITHGQSVYKSLLKYNGALKYENKEVGLKIHLKCKTFPQERTFAWKVK